jgi:hypothetical protein
MLGQSLQFRCLPFFCYVLHSLEGTTAICNFGWSLKPLDRSKKARLNWLARTAW